MSGINYMENSDEFSSHKETNMIRRVCPPNGPCVTNGRCPDGYMFVAGKCLGRLTLNQCLNTVFSIELVLRVKG